MVAGAGAIVTGGVVLSELSRLSALIRESWKNSRIGSAASPRAPLRGKRKYTPAKHGERDVTVSKYYSAVQCSAVSQLMEIESAARVHDPRRRDRDDFAQGAFPMIKCDKYEVKTRRFFDILLRLVVCGR